MFKVSPTNILEEIKWRARQHRVLNIELELMILNKIHKSKKSAKDVAKSAASILKEIKWRARKSRILNLELDHLVLK